MSVLNSCACADSCVLSSETETAANRMTNADDSGDGCRLAAGVLHDKIQGILIRSVEMQ
jgi:hypothetical protein